MTSAASAGGAAGASGVGFQNRVFAWAASYLVAEEPLQIPLVPGIVAQVGAQNGFEVDDVAVLTDVGNGVFVQAKVGLGLGTAKDSPLAKAFEQAVLQYLDGTVPEVGSRGRPLDPTRDVIVLCTDYSASATVRNDLAHALERVASQPAGTAFGKELTAKQDAALTVALDHTRRLWAAARGTEPSDEDVRTFFKSLRVLTLDLEDGRKDQQSAVSTLQRGLTDLSQGSVAWTVLVAEGQAASTAREWRDRAALVRALSHHGVGTTLPARYASDIEVVRQRSAANLQALQAEARLPVAGGLYISRSVAQKLRETASREHILVVGDAGSGKSAVVQELASARLDAEEVIVLRAADVAGTNRLGTNAPLQEVLRAWAGPLGLVVIDGVDALRGSEDRETLSTIVLALAGTRWQVVATARSFDTRNSQPLQRTFAGQPLSTDASMVDSRLAGVRHLLVGDLSDEDLDRAIIAPMPLASVLAQASSDLRKLLRNPFNLRLTAELTSKLTGVQHAQLLQVRSRVELLGRYWDWRIRNADKPAREALLKRLASSMLEGRRLQVVEEEPTVLGTDSAALESLLSQGVLSALDGPIPGVGRVFAFSHNILFDYATAIYVLYHPLDPKGLVKRLDADPTLPLVARPSFDLLVDMLWQARASDGFWPTALSVAGSEHVLASLAVASRVVNLAHEPDDLLELATSSEEATVSGDLSPRERLTSQAIGAVRARAVLPDPSNAVLPLAVLANRLADSAVTSYKVAALATDLVRALQSRAPVADNPTAPGTAERAATIAALLDAARSDAARMENLAGALVGQLEHVIGVSAEVRGAVERLLDDDAALAQWGGTVLTWLPNAILPVLAQDPYLARRLAAASMTFEETRDEDVAFGGSAIMPLRESRKQQAQHAAYQLGVIYPQICANDIITAAEIICDVFGGADSANETDMWPMVADGTTGWLEHGYGFGFSPYKHDDKQKMLAALAEALPAQQENAAQTVVGLLASKVHDGSVWAALMQEPKHPAKLGRVLLPALESGTLLAHPDTVSQAAALLKALAQEGTVPHQQLEAAVRNAINLVDQNGRSEHIKDLLIGCLDGDAITDGAIAAHRERLGDAPPDIPPPQLVIAEARPWSQIDHVLEQGVTLSPEIEEAARKLNKLLNETRDDKSVESQAIARLSDAFVDTSDVFASADTIPVQLHYLLVDVASRLARAEATSPGSSHAPLVLSVLTEAAASPDAGRFLS